MKNQMIIIVFFFQLHVYIESEPWSLRVKKTIEENFQIGNLQAMIDK